LHNNQALIIPVKEIFDDLFCNPTRTPWSKGNGIVLTVDSCYGNEPTINIHRKSYLRQYYGLDRAECQPINTEGVFRYTYGTGSGSTTVGTPINQLVFRPFSDQLKTIASNIEIFLQKKYQSDKTVVLKPFTSAVIITYINKMKIQEHRDQTFKKDGTFDQTKNSQVQDTITAILCIGDPRLLNFSFHRQTERCIEKVCNSKSFKLSHGTLVLLHPQDEVPLVRTFDVNQDLSFFKHSCNGVMEGQMSLGIVFRSTWGTYKVDKITGSIFSDDNENTKHEKAEKVLHEYMFSSKKIEDECNIKTTWNRCKERYFK